ncbi:MAG: hypothetical protein ABR866_03140, partial [Candidatus Korobacteraceae bacterium]
TGMKITPYNNHEGFSCPVTLGPQPENTGSAEAFVLIQSNKVRHPAGLYASPGASPNRQIK